MFPSFTEWLLSDTDDYYDIVDYKMETQRYFLECWQYNLQRELGENYEYDIYSIKEAKEITGKKCEIIKSSIVSDSEVKKE